MPLLILMAAASTFCFSIAYMFQDGAASAICAVHGTIFLIVSIVYFVNLKFKLSLPDLAKLMPVVFSACALVFGIIVKEPLSLAVGVLGIAGAIGYVVSLLIEKYKAKKKSRQPTNLNFSGTGSVGLRLDLNKSDE